MLIANFADLHAGKTELAAWRRQWEAALRICRARRVDLVTVAGDLFHNDDLAVATRRFRYSAGAIVRALREPMSREGAGLRYAVLQGNHDVQGAGREDCLWVFEGDPAVTVLRRCELRPMATANGTLAIAALPWLWDSRHSAEVLLEQLNHDIEMAETQADATILLGHVQVIGARMGSTICDGGEWAVTREQLEATGFDRIALGDFHRRQDLAQGRGGYVGALCQGDHGEEGNPAGFELWNTETGRVEWVEVNEAPRFQTVHASEATIAGLAHGLPAGFVTRVRIDGPVRDRAAIDQLEAAGCSVEQVADVPERQARLVEVPRGLLADQLAVLRFFAAVQNPPIPEDVLTRRLRLFESIRGDANAGRPGSLLSDERAAAPVCYDHVARDGSITPDFLGEVSA